MFTNVNNTFTWKKISKFAGFSCLVLTLLRCLFLHSVSLSQDGHVEVARLLLDSGAQVNMPADSFESPLTLAACGGHVELAALLIERGANLEEVGDEMDTQMPKQVFLFILQSVCFCCNEYP